MECVDEIPLSSMKWLLSAAKLEGIEPGILLPILGILPEQINDPLVTIAIEKVMSVRNVVKEKGKNPAFALSAGETMPLGEFGSVDYVCSSSLTVCEALENLQKYFKLMVHPDVKLDFVINDYEGRIEYCSRTFINRNMGWYEQESAEFTFSISLHRLRDNTGENIVPKKMYFKHPKPDYVDEYDRIFQTEIVFDSPVNSMSFCSETLNLEQAQTNDSYLHAILSSYAESALEKLSTENEFGNRVLRVLKDQFKHGKPTIDSVSEKLFINKRTLHRRLVAEGTSFAEVRDNLRKELAQTYLTDSRMSLDEISYLLGYANTSAFHRSFKRLTGTSPQTYRH